MDPIDKLKAEHQIILKGLAVLDSKINAIEKGAKVDTEFFKMAIDFIRSYADKYHHAKEEDILFVFMEKAGFSRQTGPIAVMLYEHDEGRQYIASLEKAITEYEQGNEAVKSEILENGAAYATLLRNHIQKEDNILYPMALNLLGKSVIDKMQKQFDEVENLQAGIEAKYLRVLESMESDTN
jgi:hemerythrin-like domain-containing protein